MPWGLPEPVLSDASSVDATLNRLRMRGDPLADAAALCLDVPPSHNPFRELLFLAKSEIGVYQALLDHANTLPGATDLTQIEQARQAQLAFNPVRQLAWQCGAVPQGLGRCPMLRADQLNSELRQRLQFHHQVNQALTRPLALQPGGALHDVLLRRRLQLALQRKALKEASWNTLEFGEPLNQEYLLLWLLEYSVLTTANMAHLGARLSGDDETAIAAFWRLAGYWLGLEPALLPQDDAGQRLLLERIRNRHGRDKLRSEQHGRVLHAHLVSAGPATQPAPLLRAIMHWCSQCEAPDLARRPPPERALQLLIAANRGATFAHYHLPGVGTLRQQLNRRQLQQEPPAPLDITPHDTRQIA